MTRISSFGTWQSPISARSVAAAGVAPSWVEVVRDEVWWAESRPAEGGRVTLVRATEDGPREVLPAPWNARNRVHEYGGRPWVAVEVGGRTWIVFTHWDDQRLYVFDPDDTAAPKPISPAPEVTHGFRYSDLVAGRDGTVWCVRETATGERPTDVRRDLVAVPISGAAASDPAAVRVLAASHHFLTAPKPAPDGRHAAWLGWDHPAMPWDGTRLCVAEIAADGSFGSPRVVAGGPKEALCQVEWADAESLYALTDPHGWWNLHRIGLDGTSRVLVAEEVEIGGPMWMLGWRWFRPLGEGRHVVIRRGDLAVLDEKAGTVTPLDTGLRWAMQLAGEGGRVYGMAADAHHPSSVWQVELDGDARPVAVTPPRTDLPDPRYLPIAQERMFTAEDGERIPAYVYPPRNPDFTAPDGEKPPYLVHVHGGPTGAVSPVLDMSIAYFTSRGIGVVAVNYGGSTGYGRAFRERLRHSWGVVDVYDCAAVATALAEEGTADGARLAIRGGSAGGWTTAASLTTVDSYRCGTSMFPILDLEAWTGDGGETHDFESQYLTGLVGPYPERAEVYRERSPLNKVSRLAGPILFLQGLDDKICPPAQPERFVEELAGSGVPHAYLAFEGEQHGFRKAETIVAAFEAELAFYGQVLGFEPYGVPPLELRS